MTCACADGFQWSLLQVALSTAEPHAVRAAALAFAASCIGLTNSLTHPEAADIRASAALHRAMDQLLDRLPDLVQVRPPLCMGRLLLAGCCSMTGAFLCGYRNARNMPAWQGLSAGSCCRQP
jgi:hypothetical protein